MSDFLYKNFVWSFAKKRRNLLALPTTEKQYLDQLYKLAERYFPERRRVDVVSVEFALNQVALLPAKIAEMKIAKNYFENFWTDYLRLKSVFDKKRLFPADGEKTRLEVIAELIAKCSQFAVDDAVIERMSANACDIMQLDENESRFLDKAIELYKIIYYCNAVVELSKGGNRGSRSLAKLLKTKPLNQPFVENKRYCQSPYDGHGALIAVADCLGGSATRYDDIVTKISTKIYLYANGRNVLDTFVSSRFGSRSCEFKSQNNSLDVTMRYFLSGNCEIRKITVKNLSKNKRKFVAETVTKRADTDAKYFNLGDALCIASETERLYVAVAVIADNKIMPCYGDASQNYEFYLADNEQITLDVVTVYAHDTPTLANELSALQYLGATQCPYLVDEPSKNIRYSEITLNPTACGYGIRKPRKVPAEKLNFTYQLGDADTATFADNAGNSTTLIRGFVFGVGGESVYSARGGIVDKLNEGDFHVDVDTLRYDKSKSSCVIAHNDGKNYEITHSSPCRTLFLFPFERKSDVSFKDNAFTIGDGERNYVITSENAVESFTTNALECNEDRLRYKLSGDLTNGTCLAICFAVSDKVSLTIKSQDKTPADAPIVRESLVSTYLNYINDKNVFCLSNYIKRPTALTLASICYTNPQFVKQYLLARFKTQQRGYYYDSTGRRQAYEDKTAFPLAYAYYRNLVGDDLPKSFADAVNGVLFGETFEGKDVCVKALILKKLAQLNTEDKVRYLIEYNKFKKQISNDSALYAYAQAIGALPMINPCKARLKDLCAKYGIEKCWYYVSQLENLYGLKIFDGKLQVCPLVTTENVLEQLALNIDGKRIDTTFAKATVKSMTLNGMQCFQPFLASSLKNADNQLVVRY